MWFMVVFDRKRYRKAQAALVSAKNFGRKASRPVCQQPFRLNTSLWLLFLCTHLTLLGSVRNNNIMGCAGGGMLGFVQRREGKKEEEQGREGGRKAPWIDSVTRELDLLHRGQTQPAGCDTGQRPTRHNEKSNLSFLIVGVIIRSQVSTRPLIKAI